MLISAAVARASEHEARQQRTGLAHLLRADESKCATSTDKMRARRIMAAAAERSTTYDTLLNAYEAQRLFDAGALF